MRTVILVERILDTYQKAWREANREKVKATMKAWREANWEKKQASSKAHYTANREKILAATRLRRETARITTAGKKP